MTWTPDLVHIITGRQYERRGPDYVGVGVRDSEARTWKVPVIDENGRPTTVYAANLKPLVPDPTAGASTPEEVIPDAIAPAPEMGDWLKAGPEEPEAGYHVELGDQRFTQAQWEVIQAYARGRALSEQQDRDEDGAKTDDPRQQWLIDRGQELRTRAFQVAGELSFHAGNAVTAIVGGELYTARAALDQEIARRYPPADRMPEEATDE